MAFGMIVRLPVSVSFGTDEEFDLRVKLEREFSAAVRGTRTGVFAGGEIDSTHINLQIEGTGEPTATVNVLKDVLSRNGLLGSAVIVLETRSPLDPDDCERQVLWPTASAGVARPV